MRCEFYIFVSSVAIPGIRLSPMRWIVWVLLGAYAVCLCLVLEDFRSVMGDEACYIDPSLRWSEGLGFTSAAWWQSPGSFWASNFPLFAFLGTFWIESGVPTSLRGLRLLSLVLYLAGIVFWIIGCRRLGWFRSAFHEVAFLLLMAGSLYATAPSQYIRPESLGALIFGFSLFGQSLRSPTARHSMAFASGSLAALAGLQFVVWVGLLALVWLLISKKKPWRAILFCVLGGAASFCALLALYWSHGVLEHFLESTFGMGSNRAAQWHAWRDPMLWACSGTLAFVLLRGAPLERKIAGAGLLAGPGLAAALFGLSKFPQYYGFLAMLPLCTATALCIPGLQKKARAVAIAMLIFAGMAGFPLSALMNWNLMPVRDHGTLSVWIQQNLGNSEAVFVDPSAYFAARKPGRVVYTQAVLNSLTPEELSSIQVAVLAPNHPHRHLQKDTVMDLLGDRWELCGAFPGDKTPGTRVPFLNFLSRLSYSGTYQFEVWRRLPR